MTSPLDLLNERYEEIIKTLKEAHKNNLNDPELDNLIEYYNSYFVAIQLLESHQDIRNLQTIVLTKVSNNYWRYRNLRNFKKQINLKEARDFSLQ